MVNVMLYPCMFCVALFVLCVTCLTVSVNCLVKLYAVLYECLCLLFSSAWICCREEVYRGLLL